MEDKLTAILIVFVVIGVPVISVFAVGAFKAYLQHQERKLQIMGAGVKTNFDDSTAAKLRDEIMQVRQVANEYDLAIQHTLDQILKRLDFLESQRGVKLQHVRSAAPLAQDDVVTVGQTTNQP